MDELQNQQIPQESQIKENFINKKNVIVGAIIIVLLLIGLGIWIWRGGGNIFYNKKIDIQAKPSVVEVQKETPQDTTSAINNELDSIGIESIDDSFKEIDADLNNL